MSVADPQDFRHGVSKAVFSTIDSHTRGRLMRWIRRNTRAKPAPLTSDGG
ncbi:group II intron maturase-specific domain-containing protein [Acrocarpospora pleiomorpha]